MNTRILYIIILIFVTSVIVLNASISFAEENRTYEKHDIAIDVNKEDKEVGLKRLELINKILSQDLINRKRSIVSNIEADYNQKVTGILNSIIPPLFGNTVFTHIDVNFFSPNFESQVEASQKISLTIILKKDGLNRLSNQYSSDQEAINAIKQLIGNSLKISDKNISVMVVN